MFKYAIILSSNSTFIILLKHVIGFLCLIKLAKLEKILPYKNFATGCPYIEFKGGDPAGPIYINFLFKICLL